jgi:hypothetical protein
VEGWSYRSIAHEYSTTIVQVRHGVQKCVYTLLVRESLDYLQKTELLDLETKRFAIHYFLEGWSYRSIAHEYSTTIAQVRYAVRKCVYTLLVYKSLDPLPTVELEEEEK